MAPKDPEKLARNQREANIAADARLAGKIQKLYGAAERRLRKELQRAVRRIEDALAVYGEASPSDLWQAARLESLIRQIQTEMELFGARAKGQIEPLLSSAPEQAVQDAEKVMGAAVRGTFNKLPTEALRALGQSLAGGAKLDTLFAKFGSNAARRARETLFTGLAKGENPRSVARRLQGDLRVSRNRALLIARTSINTARREGTLAAYKQNMTLFRGYRWVSARDKRTCPMCLAMDGTEHDLLQTFATHPACRCSMVPILRNEEPRARKSASEWFAEQSEDTQREILGDAKYELYSAGKITLQDLVDRTYSAEWGPGRSEKSISKLIYEGKISPFDVAAARNSKGGRGPGAIPPIGTGTGGSGGNIPVSKAFSVPKHGLFTKQSQEALRLIDSVHSDGALPSVPVHFLSSKNGELGSYLPVISGGPSLVVARQTTDPMFTLVHEAGHVLDFEALGGSLGPGSVNSPDMQPWLKAVHGSQHFKEWVLAHYYYNATSNAGGAAYARYLLRPWELWARSYAQFIAEESADAQLLAELREAQRINEHWDTKDFAPIKLEMRKLFKRLNWM